MKCNYKIDEDAAPYPRVKYNAECGFEYVLMEGYEFDNFKNSSGTQEFSTRSNRLKQPFGTCMKCKREIE